MDWHVHDANGPVHFTGDCLSPSGPTMSSGVEETLDDWFFLQ
jgi:hypothetical protein